MPAHTINYTFKDDAGSVPISGTTYIVAEEVNALFLVPAGAVNLQFAIQFAHLKVQDYCIALGTQTAAQQATGAYSEAAAGAATLNWNSTGTPAPAMTLNAKQPICYAPCLPGTTNLFAADVTTLFVSNSGSAALVVVIKIGLNS